MMTSADAKVLAAIQHSGQEDRAGLAYIGHVERVAAGAERRAIWAKAKRLPIDVDHTIQAAWLHDVVEDTPLELADLTNYGFPPEVVVMVDLLTKRDGRASYAEKLEPLLRSGNLGALIVKLADNEDNTSPTRAVVEESYFLRYAKARTQLLRAAAELGFVDP